MLKRDEHKKTRKRIEDRVIARKAIFDPRSSILDPLPRFLALIFLTLSFLAATGCGGSSGSNGGAPLTLGAYTTPREAYSKAIIPEFQKCWKAKTGQEVEFQESYQASGAQSRAIISGFEADIAALSLESDVARIAEAGLIRRDWQANQHRGIVSTSLVVIAVRPGNPLGIRDWTDLIRPGLRVLTPDPKTSGGAQWNIVAIYGAALRRSSSARRSRC